MITQCELNYSTVKDAENIKVSAIIVCGGSSSRMNGIDKMFAEIENVPVVALTIEAFEKCSIIENIVVVTKSESILKMQNLCETFKFTKVTDIVEGGNCRQRSVANGLSYVDSDIVLIHDGARPFVSDQCIKRVANATLEYGAVTCAVKLKDTIKHIDNEGKVLSTPDRNTLVSVQTPQGFNTELYKDSVNKSQFKLDSFTDDCSLVESLGHDVYTVDGDYKNIKITTAEDLLFAKTLIKG